MIVFYFFFFFLTRGPARHADQSLVVTYTGCVSRRSDDFFFILVTLIYVVRQISAKYQRYIMFEQRTHLVTSGRGFRRKEKNINSQGSKMKKKIIRQTLYGRRTHVIDQTFSSFITKL